MEGKVVVITGATSGIGQVAAEKLAAMGARIVQVARDRTRAFAAIERLNSSAPTVGHSVHYADLAKLSEMRRVAHQIATAESRIDLLINNAGAIFSSCKMSEGLERTFALNHMAYFVLTCGLLQPLQASATARIVSTASDAHQSATLDFEDLQSVAAYKARDLLEFARYGGPGYKVYARSKLCNVLFTRKLAKRLHGTGITANCFHPGFVATGFAGAAGGLISFSMKIAKRFALTADKGAETLIYLTCSPEVASVTGEYFQNCRVAQTAAAAQNEATGERLWAESTELAGVPC